MVDSCPPYFSENELYEMFMHNFRRHYDTNRAPLGLYFHTLWFKDKKNRKAFRKFLDEMVTHTQICGKCIVMQSTIGKETGCMDCVQLGGYSMDAGTDSTDADGEFSSMEELPGSDSS